ncbi:hypothetical protein KIM372_13900 [Bombiscardovia nodaiensis]|uniref:Uncharacterized protein n=1 Tax=Bombiscardovia nodaiensis TaxID=2932181 RepID=A0ABN6SD78_9BIFI|nr:hypothetical protein KIM372_13900 [Bombiscardovia nodaiensis]
MDSPKAHALAKVDKRVMDIHRTVKWSAAAVPVVALVLIFVVNSALPSRAVALPSRQAASAASAQAAAVSKPKLYQMLAYNDRIDTQNDELRMDFILQVPHGSVNPDCVAEGATSTSGGDGCGLTFLYSYYGIGDRATQYNTMVYLNTQGSDGKGAARWARNVDDYYTIHKVIHSGANDYLNISIEGNIDYPDDANPDRYDRGATDLVSINRVGGAKIKQYVYAIISDGKQSWANSSSHTFDAATTLDPANSTNIAEDYPAYVYAQACSPTAPYPACNGPMAFIGWDANPALWSGGQSNWGLVTDNGFDGRSEKAGVAPVKSFFVYWYNPDANRSKACSQNTSFYYQWLATKSGKWVPVSALTPQVQRVDGQNSAVAAVPPANSNTWSSFNEPASSSKTNVLMGNGPSDGSPSAQASDGSIDFKLAKSADGLDGYFKLVTWPITTNPDGTTTGCDTSDVKDAYNPEPGITANMSQADIAERVSKGWTIDTAYYRYDIARPAAPVINSPKDGSYVNTLTPTISGTGTPGDLLSLYAEDPAHPVAQSDVNAPDTKGFLIGQVRVADDGSWSIRDDNQASVANAELGTRRYHAWQMETDSGFDLTSNFSNIVAVRFLTQTDPAPQVEAVTVPHTVEGQLPAGAKVLVKGSVAPVHPGSTLKLYALPQDSTNATGSQSLKGDSSGQVGKGEAGELEKSNDSNDSNEPSDSSDSSATAAEQPLAASRSPEADRATAASPQSSQGAQKAQPLDSPTDTLEPDELVYTQDQLPTGSSSWQAQVDPQYFLAHEPSDGRGQSYRFIAVLTNVANIDAISQPLDELIDMSAPSPSVSSGDVTGVEGTVLSGQVQVAEAGDSIHFLWPDGTESTTISQADGSWSIIPPAGLVPGDAVVWAVDDQGNQSVKIHYSLKYPAQVGSLPFTGGCGWIGYASLLMVFVCTIVARAVYGRISTR